MEIDLWQPAAKGPGGEPLATCPYVFVVKHSCSDEVTSGKLDVSGKEFSLNDLRGILEKLEKEKVADAARIFVGSLNYKAVCELAKKGMPENDPNKKPTRFLLLPGAEDSMSESMDGHVEALNAPYDGPSGAKNRKPFAQHLADFFKSQVYGALSGSHVEVWQDGAWMKSDAYRMRFGKYPASNLKHRLHPDIGEYAKFLPQP